MTPSVQIIVITNIIITVSLLISGGSMVVEGYRVWRDGDVSWWPVSALIAFGGVFFGVGLVLAQGTAWRIDDDPGALTGPNGPVSIAIRGITAIICVALARRIRKKSLLTDGDRKRVNGYGPARPSQDS